MSSSQCSALLSSSCPAYQLKKKATDKIQQPTSGLTMDWLVTYNTFHLNIWLRSLLLGIHDKQQPSTHTISSTASSLAKPRQDSGLYGSKVVILSVACLFWLFSTTLLNLYFCRRRGMISVYWIVIWSVVVVEETDEWIDGWMVIVVVRR